MKVEYTQEVLNRAARLQQLTAASEALLAPRSRLEEKRGMILAALATVSMMIPAASAAQMLSML